MDDVLGKVESVSKGYKKYSMVRCSVTLGKGISGGTVFAIDTAVKNRDYKVVTDNGFTFEGKIFLENVYASVCREVDFRKVQHEKDGYKYIFFVWCYEGEVEEYKSLLDRAVFAFFEDFKKDIVINSYSLITMDVNLEGSCINVLNDMGIIFGDRVYMQSSCDLIINVKDFGRVLFSQDGATVTGRVWCYSGEVEEYKSIIKSEMVKFLESNILLHKRLLEKSLEVVEVK